MSWRLVIFIYDLIFVAVLAALAVWYLTTGSRLGAIIPELVRGLPVDSMWFGALGGLVISLKGVYEHPIGDPNGWSNRYDLWHLGRPISGAITGLMTFVLLKVLNPTGDLVAVVVYAAAFILGTQERRFFTFLSEVARLIVQVPSEQGQAGLQVSEIRPEQGHANDVLVVRGQGFDTGVVVRMGTVPLAGVTVSSDGTAVAGLVPPWPAGAPAIAADGTLVDVTVANPNGATVLLANKFKYLP